ncbi:hypothetical protein GCM10007939_08250 [Amylibacter marinus]|uniref:MAPEG family protein n=1 Tax=Amylibacter marinus TaxID=1475483 RepID=A0ABQ5VSY5_9RHOB|nr:MAPEG family protein [Amylibacter marinus]GLQ34542.1 hypothetical protein GCM10007939_08250 [Amylibacter marinus]
MSDLTLPVTVITATALAALYLAQTISVIIQRRRQRIAHGDAGDKTMMKRIRGHANTSEQVPLFLILLGLLELQSPPYKGLLCLVASLMVLGRILHGVYFLDIGAHFRYRQFGMLMTLLAYLAAILALACAILT